MSENTRSRTIEWDDPTIGAGRALTMSGLDYLRAMIAREIPGPPIAALMNMDLIAASSGEVTFSCEPNESHYNPIGAVHGGFACTVLDSVAGCAVHSTLSATQAYTTLELKVSYLKPITSATGEVRAEARTVSVGRRAAFAEATLTDATGRVLATASSTLLVFER